MNLLKNKITLLFVLGFTAFTNAALPTDISELVEIGRASCRERV